MRIIFLILCCFILLPAKSQNKPESENLSDVEKAYVLAKLCIEVKYNFVFYNDLEVNWDSLCSASLPVLLKTKSYNEFVFELKRLCTTLKDGHTTVSGNSQDAEKWIRPLPMKTRLLGNRVFVENVFSSELLKKGIDKGVEIVEINGMNVIEYGRKYIQPFTSWSTTQWLQHFPFSSFELTKGQGYVPIKLLFKDKQGKQFTYESIRSNNKWDIKSSPLKYERLNANIGYLKINDFSGDDFIKEFDEIYEKIEKSDGLIIDLRDNTGGNSGFADYITRHLSELPIKMGRWSSRMYIGAHASWNYPQEWHIAQHQDLIPVKNKNIYTKPVVLLVNAGTFSSAENFCVLFRGMNRGKLIGTTTGGSTGNSVYKDLGYGITAQICAKNEWDVQGNKFIGIGIKPDIEVKETDEIYTIGKDVVLEAALRLF